jgi:hypothetical protein
MIFVNSGALALALRSSDPITKFLSLVLCPPFICFSAILFAILFKWPLEYRVGTIVLASIFSILCFGLLLVALTGA